MMNSFADAYEHTVKLIEDEIEYHKNLESEESHEYRRGFIDGLKHLRDLFSGAYLDEESFEESTTE